MKLIEDKKRTLPLTKTFPLIGNLIKLGYFDLNIEGFHHIPKTNKRKIIYVSNHSGWFALDALMIAMALDVNNLFNRDLAPYTVIQEVLLQFPGFKTIFQRSGALSTKNLLKNEIPPFVNRIGMFPEGPEGTSKSFLNAYNMRPWKPGFAKLAIQLKALVVPITVVGAEESLPSLKTIKWTKKIFGAVSPFPIVPFPLPTNWEIKAYKAIDFAKISDSISHEELKYIVKDFQSLHQKRLNTVTKNKPLAKILKRKSEIKERLIRWA
ncbi:1-acyl-sn-glycerol-3-phosphate acyltransferase [Bacteriovoracaceae bacterium]|nr:1-acyl-sn-glycerol-3-phosphate acyltransferase [Bacteriovoracaceae bacterium]